MTEPTRGSLDGRGLRLAVVVSRFNEEVTTRLLRGAGESWRELGIADTSVSVISVPGAVEIPIVARTLARSGGVDAIVALGAVIRGETSHFFHVCTMVAEGCLRAALDGGLPVAFGVLTCETEEQALARSADGAANKGWEAVRVAVEMANLLRDLRP